MNYTLTIRINKFSVHVVGGLMVVWQINANTKSFPEVVCCCSRQMITYSAAVQWRSTKRRGCRFMGNKIIKKLKQQLLFLGGGWTFHLALSKKLNLYNNHSVCFTAVFTVLLLVMKSRFVKAQTVEKHSSIKSIVIPQWKWGQRAKGWRIRHTVCM